MSESQSARPKRGPRSAMIPAMTGAFQALVREIDSAAMQHRPLLRIRVTTDALPGSSAALPLTPERARQVRLRAYPGPDGEQFVDADPEVWLRALEIVIHPVDWAEILVDSDPEIVHWIRVHEAAGHDVRLDFMGIEVVKEA